MIPVPGRRLLRLLASALALLTVAPAACSSGTQAPPAQAPAATIPTTAVSTPPPSPSPATAPSPVVTDDTGTTTTSIQEFRVPAENLVPGPPPERTVWAPPSTTFDTSQLIPIDNSPEEHPPFQPEPASPYERTQP